MKAPILDQRTVVTFLIVASLVRLAVVVYRNSGILGEQQRQIDSLKSALQSSSLEIQEKCAKQADETYKAVQADNVRYGMHPDSSSSSNHYSSKLNHCFVEIKRQ